MIVAPPSIRLWILKRSSSRRIAPHAGCCTPFDPLVDTETFLKRLHDKLIIGCTPFDPLVDTETLCIQTSETPTSCCTPFDPLVDTETLFFCVHHAPPYSCTPFDPLVDTETQRVIWLPEELLKVAPPTIRLWILNLLAVVCPVA